MRGYGGYRLGLDGPRMVPEGLSITNLVLKNKEFCTFFKFFLHSANVDFRKAFDTMFRLLG